MEADRTTHEEVPDRRSAADVGRRCGVLLAWLAWPVAGLTLCWAYQSLRVAAGGGGDAGRVANLAWYQLTRPPGAADAAERLVRYGWYAAGLLSAAVVVLLGTGGRRAAWILAGAAAVAAAFAGAVFIDRPPGGFPQPGSRLAVHAALGGLTLACVVSGLKTRCARGAVGLLVAVLLATISGFALAGWRPAQVEDLLRHPRDLTHVLAGATIVLATAGIVRPRGRLGRRIAIAALVLAAAAVAWTGVLMTVDGSDRTAGVWRPRPPAVQTPR